jgi:hypothetical protein
MISVAVQEELKPPSPKAEDEHDVKVLLAAELW